jgi:hypothetical protein
VAFVILLFRGIRFGSNYWGAKAVLNLWLSLGLPFASRRR